MKKIVIAFLLAIMMLLVPISTVGENVDNRVINVLNTTDEDPELYVTEEEHGDITDFVEDHYEGEEETQANTIIEDIFEYDGDLTVFLIDTNELANALNIYTITQPIPEEKLTKEYVHNNINELLALVNDYWVPKESPFKDLLTKILEIIQPRLGWLFDLFVKGGELFVNGVNIAIGFIEAIQIVDFALIFAFMFNLIVSVPLLYFSETIRELFKPDFDAFLQRITNFTDVFTENLSITINQIETELGPLLELFPVVQDYVAQISEFVDWITAPVKPWEKDITIEGTVKTLQKEPYPDIEVTCRGVTVFTDSQGRYSFPVEPSNESDDSIPDHNWYGLHNCVITVKKDGVAKRQTPRILSYCFSSGSVNWIPFHIAKVKSRESILTELFNTILLRIYSLFPNLFRNINRIDVLSI
jgi:hypothetical protein